MGISRATKLLSLLLASLALVAAPALGRPATTQPELSKFDIHLQQKLATAGPDDKLAVFVLAKDVATATRAVSETGMRLADTFDSVGTAVAEGTPSQIHKVSTLPGVNYVEYNRPVKLMLDTALVATRSIDAHNGFTEGTQTSPGVDGTGISIAVLDTGIDGTHPFFQQNGKSKVVKNLKLVCPFFYACRGTDGDQLDEVFVDFTNTTNDTDTQSAGGHGTHVAGIAAGVPVTVDGKSIQGAAPGAKLVGLSVGQGLNVYGGFAGLNWVLEHHAAPCGSGVSPVDCPPIKVINNSYGGGGEWNPNGVEAKLQNGLLAAGVNVVWAAGNGDELNNGGDGSDNRVGDDAQHPGPGIIAVANYDDEGTGTRNGSLSSSSSRGQKGRPQTYPDISAPGTDILSACRPQLVSCKIGDTSVGDYAMTSGTSMASPLVAGIVAQLRQADPSLTPGDIENIIQDTAYKFTAGAPYETDPQNPDGTTSFDKGAGLIDAKAAVAKIRGINLPSETPPPPSGTACTASGPIFDDPEGDARSLLLTNTTDNVPALDLREGRLVWNSSTGTLTFNIRVLDLPEANPAGAPNISFNFNFTYDGDAYTVEAFRSASEEKFRFGDFVNAEAASARLHKLPITGSFDAANDVVKIHLSNSHLLSRGIKPFEDGDVLTAMDAVSRRAVDVQATTAGPASDDTEPGCPFTLGLGSVLPPSTGGDEDGAVSSTDPRYDFRGEILADAVLPFTGTNASLCDGTKDNQNCHRRKVKVTLPDGGANLKFTVSVPSPNAIIMVVWGPDGTKFGEGTGLASSQTVSKAATASGIYTVVLRPWVAANMSYQGYVHLGDEPPPVVVAEAVVSPTSPSYSWSRGPTTDFESVFGCKGLSQSTCDTRYIDIRVPAGGGTLKFTLSADHGEVNDFDLYIFDPDGDAFGSIANEGSNGEFTKAATKAGIYRVVVEAWLTVESTYSASVTLS